MIAIVHTPKYERGWKGTNKIITPVFQKMKTSSLTNLRWQTAIYNHIITIQIHINMGPLGIVKLLD